MNPLSIDTDKDGLSDDTEDEDKDGIHDSGETDPLKEDTDGDGLTDIMEIEGWTVSIIFEATKEQKENRQVTSNPNKKDTDNDDVQDFDEYKNLTDPDNSDSDGDGKTDYEELYNDFNSSATGIDGEPPEIFDYDCKYKIKKERYGRIRIPCGLNVLMEVGVRDIFGIDNVEIKIGGLQDKRKDTDNDDNVTVEFKWSLSGVGKYKRAFCRGFKINVTATDRNGNVGFRNEKLDSIKDIVVSAFLGALSAIAKFITELISSLFDWIYDAIQLYFEMYTLPLQLSVKDVFSEFPILDDLFEKFDDNPSDAVWEVLNTLLLGIPEKLTFFTSLFETIQKLLDPIISVMESLIDTVKDFIQSVMFPGQKDREGSPNSGNNGIFEFLVKITGIEFEEEKIEGTKSSPFRTLLEICSFAASVISSIALGESIYSLSALTASGELIDFIRVCRSMKIEPSGIAEMILSSAINLAISTVLLFRPDLVEAEQMWLWLLLVSAFGATVLGLHGFSRAAKIPYANVIVICCVGGGIIDIFLAAWDLLDFYGYLDDLNSIVNKIM